MSSKRRPSRREVIGIFLSILLGALISGYESLAIEKAPDEGSHISMVRHHTQHDRLATWEDFPARNERGHAYQLFSPIPYLAHIGFSRSFQALTGSQPSRDQLRLSGLFWCVAQGLITWLLVRELTRRTSAVIAMTLAVTLLPQLRYVHAYVNADAFTIFAATSSTWVTVRLSQAKSLCLRDSLLLGLATAALGHGKTTVYPFVLPLWGTFFFAGSREWRNPDKTSRLSLLAGLGTGLAIPLILCAWFHLATYWELQTGEVLGTGAHMELMASTYQGTPPEVAPSLGERISFRFYRLPMVWRSLWGWFVDAATLGVIGLSGLGLLFLVSCFGSLRGLQDKAWLSRLRPLLWGPILLAITFGALAFQWPLKIQGRLLLPAMIPTFLLATRGLSRILERRATRSDVVEGEGSGGEAIWIGALLIANGSLLYQLAATPA